MVWVVKIGGSLSNDDCLIDWLNVLTTFKQPVVIVPGGGPFADQVRKLQSRWKFTDYSAHHMAILAMHQFGLLIKDLNARFECCTSARSVASRLNQGWLHIIWMPAIEELQKDQVPASWDVSADSLAAWLSSKLNAKRLVLIKSINLSAYENCTLEVLQNLNIIDAGFKKMMDGVDSSLSILDKTQLDVFKLLE